MRKFLALLLSLFILLSAFSISASAKVPITTNDGGTIDMTELFEARTFAASNGTKINYRIFFPKDYDTQKKYPLILFLHGYGQIGSNNESQLELGICEPFKNPNSEIYHCIVIAPQCPSGSKWIDIPGTAWDYYCDYNSNEIKESKPLAAVAELFQKVRDESAVDKNRVYVTGISMGGFGTWDLIVRHPLYFTAAMPLCGGADYRKATVIKNIPIWTFHGQKDVTVPCTGTEKMVDALKNVGGNITYTPYPEHGHNIWEDVYKRDDIFTWLLSQKFSDRFPDQYSEYLDADETPETPTTPTQQPETPAKTKSSCKSSAEGIAPAVLAVSVATFALRKKKKKENHQ